jgi:polyamine oxidase
MVSHFSDSFDWEFAENPDVSSNYYAYVNADSYDGNFGPNSDGNNFVIDQRGFKYIFLQEANQFLKADDPRLMLNTTVKNIKYSNSGVVITSQDGSTIQADYAISTFRYVKLLKFFELDNPINTLP